MRTGVAIQTSNYDWDNVNQASHESKQIIIFYCGRKRVSWEILSLTGHFKFYCFLNPSLDLSITGLMPR